MNKLFCCTLLVALAAAVPVFRVGSLTFTSEEEALFARFKIQHGKVYTDERDEAYRKQVFAKNLAKIRTHNEEGKHTYTLAMNEFGDMSFEEFHAKFTGYKGLQRAFARTQNMVSLKNAAADSVDWTTKGAVTPVKNQGQCGSCWAFSTTGAVEGAWKVAGHDLVSLSEQELMDCSKAEGNQSCEGGLMDDAFQFIIKNKGICSESDYPYKMKDEKSCTKCTSVASITGFVDVPQSEDELAKAVTLQPVAVAIEADQEAFQFYSSGVLTGDCGTNLDHGVLAVGYGELNGTQYWKVKNSWGASWGLNGFILIEKGKSQSGGQCGILMAASYATVAPAV